LIHIKIQQLSLEIERKFLVNSQEFIDQATTKFVIKQGFLTKDPKRTVRIRVKNDQGFITVKGASNDSGTSRFEWEKEISAAEAESLLKLCLSGMIAKIRYEIPVGKHLFEVDIFQEENEGLILAEVELQNENEVFEKPDWLGKEVTGDNKYYNSQLSQYPFKNWNI